MVKGAARLARWLEKNRKHKVAFSREVGVTDVTLWRWLNGERVPQLGHSLAIETITGIPASAWVPATKKAT